MVLVKKIDLFIMRVFWANQAQDDCLWICWIEKNFRAEK